MTSKKNFLNSIIEKWNNICIFNYRIYQKDDSVLMPIKKQMNFRVSKTAIFKGSKQTLTRKEFTKILNECIKNGDINKVHGHYRLSKENMLQYLHYYKKYINKTINIDYLYRFVNNRNSKMPMLTKIVEKIIEVPLAAKIEPIKNSSEIAKRALGGFVRLFDCLKQNDINFDHIVDMNVDESFNLIIDYENESQKTLRSAVFANQWREYNDETEIVKEKDDIEDNLDLVEDNLDLVEDNLDLVEDDLDLVNYIEYLVS